MYEKDHFIRPVTSFVACKKEDTTDPTLNSPTPVTSLGSSYAGGTVFYLSDDGQHGLVYGPVLDTCKFALNTNVTGTTWTFGSGPANTDSICASQGAGVYAARLCKDLVLNGYSDWYLYSQKEFEKLNLFHGSHPELWGDLNGVYWTSTGSGNSALVAQFAGSMSDCTHPGSIDYLLKVRPIRSF